MKSSPKTKSVKVHKDGYGAHWHSVGWLAAIAIVLSASTMSLSASAQTASVTPSVLLRSLNDIKVQLSRMEAKIDRLGTQCTSGATAQCPSPTTQETPNGPANSIIRDGVQSPAFQAPTQEVLSDVTRCRQSCEDEFNACAKKATNDSAYSACKAPYETCFTGCK